MAVFNLLAKVARLEIELFKKKKQLEKYEHINVVKDIDVFIGDVTPTNEAKRKNYVALVASLHKEILEPKMKELISNTLVMLSRDDSTREDDLALKGAVTAYKEIIYWGKKMTNEYINNNKDE